MRTVRKYVSPASTGWLRLSMGLACASLLAGCAGEQAAPAPGPDIDAFAAGADRHDADALRERASDLVRPGSVVQTEPRLGVPTFLWARSSLPSSQSRGQWLAAGLAEPEVAAARAALSDFAPLYGLGEDDVAGAVVAHVHDRGHGPILVEFRAEIDGIEIFREELNVVMDRDLQPVALSGYLTSAAAPARPGGTTFALAPAAAAAVGVVRTADTAVDAGHVMADGSRDGYDRFQLAPAAGIELEEPVRVKRVYFHAHDGLEAAYYVEVYARTGAPAPDTLTLDGSRPRTPEAHAYVVSAGTGQVLFHNDLTAHRGPVGSAEQNALPAGGFTYRVWADPVTGIPYDTPAGNDVHPKVVPLPDGQQAAFVAPSDVTLPNFPFSQGDPWLAPGATETVGNNVDAFVNLVSPDGYGPSTTTPTDPPTADYRAQITGTDQFLHTHVPDDNGGLAEGRQGSIQQLFYTINFLHDWYYDAGFDEAAGNAQTNNFGRGGLGSDSMRAQAQDFASFNNANMTTGADGVRPRMRMYRFPAPANVLELQDPVAVAGDYTIGISQTGTQRFEVSSEIVRATFANAPSACTVTNAAALDGKIAMFDFDNTDGVGCAFSTRIARIHATSASASLMVYTSAAPGVVANITGSNATHTKPIATISWNTGQAIKGQLSLPAAVTARLFRAADRDGSLDNQLVFHEFFHYVSNRLVANGSGLGTNHAGGLGEGWADFNGMLLTVREDDTAVPGNPTFGGVYSLATFATSGEPYNGSLNHGYYFGIRRYPYSTDMAINPLTFRHITNGVALPVGPPVSFGADGANNAEVHNTGEVWATMLWECYAGLLRDTLGPTPRLTFQQAQDRMKGYLISALKVTPPSPTLTEARDALLAVALASDPVDYVTFRLAFARRGAGLDAVSPDRFSADNSGVVEDFASGPDLALESATLDDDLGSCDADDVVDHGEYGELTVTLRNTGTTDLSDTTATISSPSADVWFPLGGGLSFPAIPVGGIASASLRVAYLGSVSGVQQVDFQIDYTDAQLSTPLTDTVGFRTNTDDIPASTATDTVEPVTSPAATGFNATFGDVAPWHRLELSPLSHAWHVDDHGAGSDQYLISPVMTVDGSGSFNLQFDHSWAFEFDGGGNYDGGVVELSVNGGAFTDIGTSAYNGTLTNYTGNVNPLRGRPAFVQSSGSVHTSLTQAVAPGSTVQLRFRAASDNALGAPGWTIDNIAYTGVVETPFATLVADGDSCAVVPTDADLAVTVTDGVTSVTAGGSLTYTIVASNLGPDDIVGAAVADDFPADLTCTWTCAGAGGGGCTAAGTGDIQDLATLPVGGTATYTASCTVSASTANTSLSNTASIAPPGPVADPTPGNDSATDVDALIRLPALLFASKTVDGDFVEGGAVTYTIELGNDGAGRQFDNAGDELVDVLPAEVTLIGASASSGTAVATVGTNTVTWNGSIEADGSVTITIDAVITAAAGALVSNQASFAYDADGDATNEATGTSDAYPCPPGP